MEDDYDYHINTGELSEYFEEEDDGRQEKTRPIIIPKSQPAKNKRKPAIKLMSMYRTYSIALRLLST